MHVLKASLDNYNSWKISQLDYISQFTPDIRCVRGNENPVAGALSRVSVYPETSVGFIDMQLRANEQEQSDCESPPEGLKIERLHLPKGLQLNVNAFDHTIRRWMICRRAEPPCGEEFTYSRKG